LPPQDIEARVLRCLDRQLDHLEAMLAAIGTLRAAIEKGDIETFISHEEKRYATSLQLAEEQALLLREWQATPKLSEEARARVRLRAAEVDAKSTTLAMHFVEMANLVEQQRDEVSGRLGDTRRGASSLRRFRSGDTAEDDGGHIDRNA